MAGQPSDSLHPLPAELTRDFSYTHSFWTRHLPRVAESSFIPLSLCKPRSSSRNHFLIMSAFNSTQPTALLAFSPSVSGAVPHECSRFTLCCDKTRHVSGNNETQTHPHYLLHNYHPGEVLTFLLGETNLNLTRLWHQVGKKEEL